MGFFHIENINRKWYLMSPDGAPFLMRGVNHYGDGTHMPVNLDQIYGDAGEWRKSVRDRQLQWGFNYLPPSIGPSETDTEPIPPSSNAMGRPKFTGRKFRTPEWPAKHFAEMEVPFTALLGRPKQYMAGPGLPDVFSREFRECVDKRCREFCAELKDNPNLIGYHFCHNPSWHPLGAAFFDWCNQIVTDGGEAKKEWAFLMRKIYGTVERWRETYSLPIESLEEVAQLDFPMNGNISAQNLLRDKISFMKRVCAEWYKVYAGTVRKYDPNHLILGDRNTVHLQPLSDWAVHIMAGHVDVLSINVMGPMPIALEEMEQVTRHWDGPILIADTGAGIYNGSYPKSTYMCRDIAEFEEVYSGYAGLGVDHPQVIGFGWCGYYETRSSRSGLVDAVTDEPDNEKIRVVKKWNKWSEEQFRVKTRRSRKG
jgi:hypothetical protein